MFLLLLPLLGYECSDSFTSQQDVYLVSFLGAMLTASGVFLTLFYTNMLSAYANKYPRGSGKIAKLYLDAVVHDENLSFCNSYVITIGVSFSLIIFIPFNYFAYVYICILSVILLVKIPSVANLFTSRTDLGFVATFVSKRFLAAAEVATIRHQFYRSRALIERVHDVAIESVASLKEIMKFSISIESDGKMSSDDIVIQLIDLLVLYEEKKVQIPIESHWHIRFLEHKKWFEADIFEQHIVLEAGAVPFPREIVSPDGFEREILSLVDVFHKYLYENDEISRLANSMRVLSSAMEAAIGVGCHSWIKEYFPRKFTEALDHVIGTSVTSKSDFGTVCELLDACALGVSSVVLQTRKLVERVQVESFTCDSFASFGDSEVTAKGFPISNSPDIRDLCSKIRNELFVEGGLVTPSWYFDKQVSVAVSYELEQLMTTVESLIELVGKALLRLIDEEIQYSYILTLREVGIGKSFKALLESVKDLVGKLEYLDSTWLEEVSARQSELHASIVVHYPAIVDQFQKESVGHREMLPDLFGFTYQHYSQLLFDDVLTRGANNFLQRLPGLYFMAISTSINETGSCVGEPSSDLSRIHLAYAPLIYFFELCGMAFAHAELFKKEILKRGLNDWLSSHLHNFPGEVEKWRVCLEHVDNRLFFGTVVGSLQPWRSKFLSSAIATTMYSEVCDKSINRQNLTDDEERLLEMIPNGQHLYSTFDGCEVFKKYIFEPIIVNLAKDGL
ncbi:hypothetical protein [Arcanobacterium phocae]|uniref:hypothetical protein n=1 Tax=Arcanobacterium phocae TaxID=131112 RepID=UPI001C1013C1|nr:hypothetical protein [Arcanobacterium phocae]